MSISADSEAIFQYHRNMISVHGNWGTSALGWRDAESQTIRFEELAELADLNGHSVFDAGCGHGDLRSYLHNLYPNLVYYGMEQIPELLKEAQRRYKHWPATVFMPGNFMTDAIPATDYVMASGSLNYHQTDPEFIYKAIAHLYAHCRRGLGFNLLSRVIPNGLIVSYNPTEILNYCTSLSPASVLRNDYSDEDFTIFMYR